MFGYKIVHKLDLEVFEYRAYLLNKYADQTRDLIDQNTALQDRLDDALTENKRLFDLLAQKQSQPKRDKNGLLRARDGKFAKKPKKRDILLQQQAP